MSKVHDLGIGWQALEVAGRGVVVAAGNGIVFFEDARIDEDGNLVAAFFDVQSPAVAKVKPGPSSIAGVNVAAFMEETARRNLTADGHYGSVGPIVGKLREVLDSLDDGSPVAASLGNLLALGDHGRFGAAAVIVGMGQERLDEFVRVLAAPEADAVEEFVDKCITSAA
jgi:hypothetical protein